MRRRLVRASRHQGSWALAVPRRTTGLFVWGAGENDNEEDVT